jgi:hypothetical protein
MTQPTQDPWGNNQQPPTPPQPTPQPYVFPQPGYGPQPQPPVYPQQQQPPPVYYQQPGYPQQPQQQPGLWNPSGVYGGVTVKKPGMPVWGWVLVVVAALVIIGGVASTNKSTTSTATTSQQVVATAAPLDNSSTSVTNATATAYAAKVYSNMTAGAESQKVTSSPAAQQGKLAPTPVSVKTAAPAVQSQTKSNDVGVKVAGPGQELVGQGGVDSDLKITVTSVERYSQVFDSKGNPIPSQGVFLVVLYDKENVGSEPHGFTTMRLIDGNGRKFSSSSNMDATFAFAFSDSYHEDLSIQPSFKGKGYTVFEVPPEASNFKLKLGF